MYVAVCIPLKESSLSARRPVRPAIIAILSAALLALTAGSAAAAVTLGQTPIPTWQTNGRVLTVLRANGVVYVGGQFTQVMDSSGGTVTPRNRLAAFDASTGALLPWDPDANDTVRALSVSQDASTIFVGGNFTLLNGSPRQRVAEVQAETVGSGTGVVVPGWAPQVDAPVWSTAVLSGQLYIGGEFQHVNGVKRDRVAAINTGSGKLNTVWAPRANKVVRAVLVSPNADKIFIGGYFDSFDGKTLQHLVAVTPNSGALMPWPGRPGGAVKSLAATASSLFAGDAGGGGHVRAYVLSSGKPRWTNTANGDVERVATYQGDVVAGGHFTMMGAFASQHIVALSQATGKVDPSWTPSADSVHGVFSLLGYGQQFYAGGDFTRWFPGNVAQAHYAEFTTGVSDMTPPTVTGPPKLVVALGTQLGATVIPTRISFLASDNGVSGVCRYQLQKSFASGPYAGVSLPWINAAYAKLQIAPSPKAYRFQLKATDCADNASAFVPGAPVVLGAVQDSSSSIHYAGSWKSSHVAKSYGGTVRTTTKANSSATLSFTGREIVWVGGRDRSHGVARVYIDGHLVKTQNLYAGVTIRGRAVFTRVFATSGPHTIKVVAAGTKGHPAVDVDAFLTLR